MKNLSKKMYIIWISVLFGFLGFWFLLSSALTIPGQGLQSLSFIKTVEKQIDRLMPKDKFVLKSDSAAVGLIPNILKTSYEAEVLSTLNVDGDYQVLKTTEGSIVKDYVDFADDWFDNTWGDTVDTGGNIDLNAIGHDLVAMDKAIAGKFHSESYISAGIQFLYTNTDSVKDIFSKELMEDSKNQSKSIDLKSYDTAIKYNREDMESNYNTKGLLITHGAGTYIAANKAWFLNQQKQLLSQTLGNFLINSHNGWLQADGSYGKAPMTGEEYLTNKDFRDVTVDDLKAPNFTSSLNLLRAGTVMTLMTPFFAAVIIPLGTLIIIWNRK
jgi:hypothetical protein